MLSNNIETKLPTPQITQFKIVSRTTFGKVKINHVKLISILTDRNYIYCILHSISIDAKLPSRINKTYLE